MYDIHSMAATYFLNLIKYNHRLKAYEQKHWMKIWTLVSGNNQFQRNWISTKEEKRRSALTTPEVITGSS